MTPLPELREHAVALRRAGKPRREIKEILHIRNNDLLTEALRGEPPPLSSRRPNAKDDLRAKARQLRQHGLDYKAIAAELGVSKSSVSLWVRDLPRPERLSHEECQKRHKQAMAKYWSDERVRIAAGGVPKRTAFADQAREARYELAATQIGPLTDRDIFIGGVVAYWCEGAKNKPGRRRSDRVIFVNTDPDLITFFLRFLDLLGVDRATLIYRVYIHETADIARAEQFWLDVTGADPALFRRPSLKRHRPTTKYNGANENYYGCLRIDVRRSSGLFTTIEGWSAGILRGQTSSTSC